MISWGKAEIDLSSKVHNVDVTELEIYDYDKDEKSGELKQGKQIISIPIVDLTNSEMLLLQSDPILKDYSGSVSDSSSAKAQVYGLLVTHQRMYKANQNLGFSVRDMLKWTTTRSNALVMTIKKHLDDVQKKSQKPQKQTKDKI